MGRAPVRADLEAGQGQPESLPGLLRLKDPAREARQPGLIVHAGRQAAPVEQQLAAATTLERKGERLAGGAARHRLPGEAAQRIAGAVGSDRAEVVVAGPVSLGLAI